MNETRDFLVIFVTQDYSSRLTCESCAEPHQFLGHLCYLCLSGVELVERKQHDQLEFG